jgi:SAM-dependent methyltransferase
MSIGWMQPLYQTMSSERKPPQQDPAAPEFWDQRFRTGVTPWDAGGVPNALREFALACGGPRRVLIPGCGSGWEARYLAELGWDVTALDFSAGAIAAARINLGPYGGCLVQADYFRFDPDGAFDVIYERTFLCAMPRRMWPKYASRTFGLLRPGGLLVGFFYFSDEPKGPPFGTSAAALAMLLEPWFSQEEVRDVDDSIPLFRGRERWEVWRRRAASCVPGPT